MPTFSEPSVANTAGTMMKPAMSATSVSIVQMSAVFLPRFSCLGRYEPWVIMMAMPSDREKNACPSAERKVLKPTLLQSQLSI